MIGLNYKGAIVMYVIVKEPTTSTSPVQGYTRETLSKSSCQELGVLVPQTISRMHLRSHKNTIRGDQEWKQSAYST